MRIAIFSDVHGNLHALDAVLADIARADVRAVYCLGDLVGYGAFPNEAIERVRLSGTPTVIGNYDDGVGFGRDECGCAYRNPVDEQLGQRSLSWTKSRVTSQNKLYMQTLAKEIRFLADGKRVLLVHGSPRKLNEYLFEDRPVSSFHRIAETSNADIIAFGHTHKPYVKVVSDVMFVNVGSVGKPKDHDWRACYAILDTTGTPTVTFRRVEYDVQAAARAIRETGLPAEFAADIESGGAPRVQAT